MLAVSRSRLRAAAALWGILLVPLVVEASTSSGSWPRAAESVGGALLLAGLVAAHRRAPFGVLGAAAAVATVAELVVAPTTFGPARVWPFAATVAFAYLAGRRVPEGRPVLATMAGVAVSGLPIGLLFGLISDGGARGGFGVLFAVYDWSALVLGLLLAVAPPWLLGRYRRQGAALVAAGWERAELLERQQRLESEQARLAERARIAQDMHDSLGHEWTLIALRAAALQVSPHLDDAGRAAAGELRAGIATATERLRDVIGVLRAGSGTDAGTDTVERPDVADLVDRATAAGMTVHWEPAPEPADLPVMVGHAAHRVVQEALTNAARHAPGAAVNVRLEHRDGATTVTVTSGAACGSAPPVDLAGGGSGLVALQERVRLLGGTLTAGPDGPGFTVAADLPHHGRPAGRPPDGARAGTGPSLQRARAQVRRDVTASVRVPLLAGACVIVLALGLFLLVGTANRLDPATFDRLPTGAEYASVAPELPPFQVLGDPGRTLRPPPPGTWCRYYWSSRPADDRLIFRLCFAGDRLVAKEAVPRAALSGPSRGEGTS